MKIAIVKLSALGDIVHAMVALQFIKQTDPSLTIDWVVEQAFANVLQYNHDVNHILTVNLKKIKKNKFELFQEINNIRQYRKNQYDLVIDAQGLIKSAITSRLLGSNIAGFHKTSTREKLAAYFYNKTVQFPYDANTIDRNVAVITQSLGIQVSQQQILDKQIFLFYQKPDPELKRFFSKQTANIVFIIGSTWPSRNYPKEQYLRVINGLNANSLIIWGNEQEKQIAEWITSKTHKANVLPKLNLNNLKAVLAQADLVIGNDTGPTHMAWGLNKPSITLFGPTPVSRVYQTPINIVLKSSSIVNPFKLDKNDFSISEIQEHKIIEVAESLLN